MPAERRTRGRQNDVEPATVHLGGRVQAVCRDQGRLKPCLSRSLYDVCVMGAGSNGLVAIDEIEAVDRLRDLVAIAIRREWRDAPVGDRNDDHARRLTSRKLNGAAKENCELSAIRLRIAPPILIVDSDQ